MINHFFDELSKIASVKTNKSSHSRIVDNVNNKIINFLKNDLHNTKWGRHLTNVGQLLKSNSYVDDLESPPSQALMPEIRNIHGLGKRSSWMDIGPEGQREGKAWKPIDPPFKLAALNNKDEKSESRLISHAVTRSLGHEPYSIKNPDKNTNNNLY